VSKPGVGVVPKNCGSCKWLDVPARDLVKSGLRTHGRCDYSAYACTVPFEMPPIPDSIRVELSQRRFTCPTYGADCAFHEARVGTHHPENAQAK
jgi:hypothetical protein